MAVEGFNDCDSAMKLMIYKNSMGMSTCAVYGLTHLSVATKDINVSCIAMSSRRYSMTINVKDRDGRIPLAWALGSLGTETPDSGPFVHRTQDVAQVHVAVDAMTRSMQQVTGLYRTAVVLAGRSHG